MSRQINLFNPDFCQQRIPFSAALMLQVMAVLTVIGTLSFAYARYQVFEQESHVLAMEKKLASERNRLEQVTSKYAQLSSNTLLEAEVMRFESMLNANQHVVDMLQADALGNSHGFSEYMRAFARQLLNGLWLTGFTISNAEMALTGRLIEADLMPAYLQRLKHEKVMQGRSFSKLQINIPKPETDDSEKPQDYFEFSLSSSAIEEKE